MSWDWTKDTLSKLEVFLRDRGLAAGPLKSRGIGEGHSNLTFLVSDGERELVVRRPPPPPIPPGGHDVLREARLIQALGGVALPVARVLAVGGAGAVLDVPFYVMEYVPGVVITEGTPPALATPACRRNLAEQFIDRLADLHAVDWRACGLGNFGRPEGFNSRHLRRIAGLVADDGGAMPAAFVDVHGWLADNVPTESGATIIHNDYRFGNVMWAAEPPARLLAILDWELATLGDPLMDVGYVVASCPRPGEPPTPVQDFAGALLEPGFPSGGELVDRYAARTQSELPDLRWYVAMAHWKLAVLYEYSRLRGEDAYYADRALVRRFLDAAHRAAGLDPSSGRATH